MAKTYSYDEVHAATLEYFNGDELATNVFFKYALKDKEGKYHEKTPDDMHRRMAKEFARIEKKYGGKRALTEKEIYSYFKNFSKICPQGSPMYGIGNDYQNVSISNCVVVDSPDDTVSGIFDTGKHLANLFKRRCGVGLDISTLRPDGASVSNSASTSSGAWSFGDFYSYITRMIGQNNRRGACLLSMDVRHPDILKFISMKHNNSKVTGANISVKLTDDFMRLVRNDEAIQLQWPVDSDNPKYSCTENAKKIWEAIVDSATQTAEPGLLMWGNVLKYLPAECYRDYGFKHISTNPCVTADTWVTTRGGPRQVRDLIGKQFEACIDGSFYGSKGFFKTGNEEIWELETTTGHKIRATKDHKILTPTGWIKLKNLTKMDSVVLNDNTNLSWRGEHGFDEGWIVGQVVGDGCFNPDSYPGHMEFWGENAKLMAKKAADSVNGILSEHLKRGPIGPFFNERHKKYTVKSRAIDKLCERYIKPKTKESLPALEMGSSDFCRGFLCGLFDADGSVQGNLKKGVSIRLTQSNLGRLRVVQRMLSRLGIVSKIYVERKAAREEPLPDGHGGVRNYKCKATHEIIISRDMVDKFADVVGFREPHKTERLRSIKSERTRDPYRTNYASCVKSVKALCVTEDVYDCSVDVVCRFDANGILVHNCGELPLSKFDSCRLISCNLKGFVKKSFSDVAYFDFDEFYNVVRVGQKLSDNLVDLELEKLANIIEVADAKDEKELFKKLYKSCEDGRRTGLGTHGLADALARLNMAYDSDEALEIVEVIYNTLKVASYTESVELSKERGAFSCWNWDLEKDNLFIRSLPKDLQRSIQKHGRRNISNLTNAPTGSVSILSQTSSGIEPVFKNSYRRRRKLSHDEDKTPDFIDKMGDQWIEFDVFHHNVKEWTEANPDKELPDFFVESENINWIRRLEVQAAIQKGIDHSISSTINLPKGTSSDVVGELYMKGWELGLKGITVYVDGSRDGVLLKKEGTQKKDFHFTDATKRPAELDCDIHSVSIKGEKWAIFVGLLNERPYEVFGGLSENIEIPSKYKKGTVIKISNRKKAPNRYDLKLNGLIIKDIIKQFNNTNYQLHTRMVSLALRHGTKPSFLVEQLLKDPDNNMTSFSKVVARVLKKYIEDGTKVTSGGSSCQECGNKLVYQDGCVLCPGCGWSKC